MASNPTTLALPTNVVTLSDVGKLLRELEVVENKLLQLKMRHGDEKPELPSVTKRLQHLAELNKLNLLHENDCTTLKTLLAGFKEKAPQMYISFSSEPTPDFLEKLIVWLRREINPNILVNVGLQPTIGAGCVVRTTNKYFDLSLRQTFMNKRELLLEQVIPAATTEAQDA